MERTIFQKVWCRGNFFAHSSIHDNTRKVLHILISIYGCLCDYQYYLNLIWLGHSSTQILVPLVVMFSLLQSLASQKYVEVLNVPTFHCVKFPYSELFSSAFSRIRTKYGEILRVSPYSVRMPQNADQNNSEYGNVLRCVNVLFRQSKFSFSKIFFSGVVFVLYFFCI